MRSLEGRPNELNGFVLVKTSLEALKERIDGLPSTAQPLRLITAKACIPAYIKEEYKDYPIRVWHRSATEVRFEAAYYYT